MFKQKILILILLLFLVSCHSQEKKSKNKIKNLILLIGDGMGYQELNMGNLYLKHAPHSPFQKKELDLFKNSTFASTSLVGPYNKLVVDSACSATQLSTGEPALNETIGVNYKGEKTQTLLELAQSLGKSTGLISNTRITHATPASFMSHVTSRHHENEIAEQVVTSNVDFLASGGLRHFLPQNYKGNKSFQENWKTRIEPNFGHSSKRKDDKNLLEIAQNNGYKISFNFDELKNSTSPKDLALLANSEMSFAIDLKENQASVPEITKLALDKLSKNPKGFFLMVEEGLIDWCGHANDAGSLLREVLQMDRTYKVLLDWAKNRDDTLIIVTADHETGGFGNFMIGIIHHGPNKLVKA